MKPTFLFCLSILFLVSACQNEEVKEEKPTTKVDVETYKLDDYFPLRTNDHFIYSWKFSRDGIDTVRGIDTVYCRSVAKEGMKIFYFDDDTTEMGILGVNTFGNGVYQYLDGALHLSPLDWERELSTINSSYFKLLMPAEIEKDVAYEYNYHPCIRKFRCTGFESIVIDGKKIDQCLKFETEENWPEKQYKGAFWLLKDFGVVKTIKSTGRVEEIDISLLP